MIVSIDTCDSRNLYPIGFLAPSLMNDSHSPHAVQNLSLSSLCSISSLSSSSPNASSSVSLWLWLFTYSPSSESVLLSATCRPLSAGASSDTLSHGEAGTKTVPSPPLSVPPHIRDAEAAQIIVNLSLDLDFLTRPLWTTFSISEPRLGGRVLSLG